VLYQHVEFCPYCGADHPLEPAPRKRAGAQLRAVDTQPPAPAKLATEGSAGVSPLVLPDMPIPPLDVPQPLWQTAGRWIVTKGVVLLLFILALGYAGYLLLGDNRKQDTGSDEPTNSASTSGGSISPYTPPPGTRDTATTTVTNVPVPKTPAMSIAPPKPRVVPHYRDVPDALRAARAGLVHNSLADAKAALSDALSIEPNNTEALQMQSDLKDRENGRDAALSAANACAKDKLWSCVRDRASQALAIDVSSVDAQALLERVILSTGWKPLAGAAASSPRAATGTTANMNTNAKAAANNTVTGNPASGVSSIDAQMRAIRESGWKQQPASANKQ
jgi:hypothetical protein